MFWTREPLEMCAVTYVGVRIKGTVELCCVYGR